MDLDFLSLNKNEAGILRGLGEGPLDLMTAMELLPFAALTNPKGIHTVLSRLEDKGMVIRAWMEGKTPLFKISDLGRLMMAAWKYREYIRKIRREEG